MTVVDLDGAPLKSSPEGARLNEWAARLAPTIDGVPPTQALHGYSGRWSFFLECDRWRRLQIRDRDIACTHEGAIRFRSQTFARQRVKHLGNPWPEEGLSEEDVGPWTFRWELEPALGEPEQMLIRFETDFEAWSSGKGRARKET